MILELYHVLHVECLILFCAAIIAYQIKDLTLEEGVWWSCINWKYIIYWAIFFLYKTPLKHKNDNMTVNVNIIITTLHSYIWRWILVYNQWLFRLHLYLFPPLLQFVCLFFFFTFSPPPPQCFCLLVTLVSRYPFWQLSNNHNMDVHYPVRYRLYMPWTPSYNTRRKSLKEKLFLCNFLKNFLHSLFTPLFSLKCAPSPSPVLSHVYFGDHCNSQIYIGEGETHTSVSTLLTSIVLIPSHY